MMVRKWGGGKDLSKPEYVKASITKMAFLIKGLAHNSSVKFILNAQQYTVKKRAFPAFNIFVTTFMYEMGIFHYNFGSSKITFNYRTS